MPPQFYVFLKLCGTISTCLLLTIQCSWTPEVETLVHNSQQGRIVLQTSSTFHIPPKHPQDLSTSLIKRILGGISKAQETGILQELFLSSSAELPAFSQAQIDFLTPQLVDAFSLATPEELIVFRTAGDEKRGIQVRGTIAVFSPTIFFLTLQNLNNYPGHSAKTASSRNLQKKTTLMFSEKQAVLQRKDAQRFMTVPSKDSWIAIDYAALSPSMERNQNEEQEQQTPPRTDRQSEKSPPDMNSIQKQLQDLRNTVDEQAKEIRRLQEAAP